MGITALGERPAPAFRLTDQSGATVTLSQIDQHPIVLAFFDTTCIDVCPLLAQEFLGAAKQLGPLAGDVSFVAVNVGVAHSSTADVEAFTTAHGLGALPHWYFLTGTPSQLRPVWSSYGVTVEVDPVTGGVLHTSILDFLSPGGRLAYQAVPFANQLPNGTGSLPAAVIEQWEKGIASYAAKTMNR
jgi:cytochrome oxidase Cu insertion factor (SCO1/SenC/PrrC family)